MKHGKGGRKKTESSWRNALKWRPNRLPKLRRGNDAQRRQGARRKKQNGGQGRSNGPQRSRRVDAWRRKRRGKGKRKN